MTHRPVSTRRLARWSLLLAAVLQLGGAAVGPYLHFSAFALAGTSVAAPQGEGDPAAPYPQHDEQACIVCQTVAGPAIVPSQSLLPFASVVLARVPLEPSAPLRRASRAEASARAPPSA